MKTKWWKYPKGSTKEVLTEQEINKWRDREGMKQSMHQPSKLCKPMQGTRKERVMEGKV